MTTGVKVDVTWMYLNSFRKCGAGDSGVRGQMIIQFGLNGGRAATCHWSSAMRLMRYLASSCASDEESSR